ncbi:MAG: hypothetical protein ACAI44_39880 [Candidatus Sericytochromatia bacterium]
MRSLTYWNQRKPTVNLSVSIPTGAVAPIVRLLSEPPRPSVPPPKRETEIC